MTTALILASLAARREDAEWNYNTLLLGIPFITMFSDQPLYSRLVSAIPSEAEA